MRQCGQQQQEEKEIYLQKASNVTYVTFKFFSAVAYRFVKLLNMCWPTRRIKRTYRHDYGNTITGENSVITGENKHAGDCKNNNK